MDILQRLSIDALSVLVGIPDPSHIVYMNKGFPIRFRLVIIAMCMT